MANCTRTTTGSLGGQYRKSSEALRGRIEELEAVRAAGEVQGLDLELLSRRLIKMQTMYCDTVLLARFLERYPHNQAVNSEFLGIHVSW